MVSSYILNEKLEEETVEQKLLPASIAFFAAILKSLTIIGISSVRRRCGGGYLVLLPSIALFVLEIGGCPFG